MALDDPPDDPVDRYDELYTRKLWNLVPAVYRARDVDADADVDAHGPLEELVARIGAQIAVVRRSIDRLWEDQSIETCDDRLIDYLGELLATNQVAGLDARGRRLDVFNTISYRRRKGTVGLLEELATAITGWGVRVVEMAQRLGRTRHGLDPELGRPALPRFSTVARAGTGTGTLALGGAPVADHAVTVRIDAVDVAGIVTWSVSLDGTLVLDRTVAAAATIDTPGGGTITIALVPGSPAPSFVAGDTFGFAVSVDPVVQLQRVQGVVGARTGTGSGGYADLRDVHGATLTGGAFDEYAHTADVRRGRGATGHYAIPRIGVFAWRLRSLPADQVTPVAHARCAGQWTFDPSGRDVPLFAAGARATGDQWVSPRASELPGPITREMLRDELVELYRAEGGGDAR